MSENRPQSSTLGKPSERFEREMEANASPLLTDRSFGNERTVEEKEDSGVFDFGCQYSNDSGKTAVSFASWSYEIVQHWSHCSYSAFESISLQDLPSLDRRSSAWLAGINVQSMILGTSVLGFPFAFMNAGIWAIPLVVIIGTAASVSAGLLRDCLYQNSRKHGRPKRVRRTYVDVCNGAWPMYGRTISELIVFIGLLRNVIVLILLTNLSVQVLGDLLRTDKGIITVSWAFAVLPFLFIKRVSSLAWISFIGLSLYLVALAAILVQCLLHYPSWSFANLHFDFHIEKIGLAAGIIINSFAQHLSFPPVEGSMRKPKTYRPTFFVTFAINVIVKVLFGVSAVLTYGSCTKQSITGNLSDRKISVPANSAIAFFAYFTLPMQSFVVFDLIDSKFLPHFPIFKGSASWSWMLLSRSVVLVTCLLVAVLVPEFGLLVSFVGSIRGSFVSLMFPPLFYLKLFKHKVGYLRKIQCVAVALIGLSLGSVGIYSSSKAVISLWV